MGQRANCVIIQDRQWRLYYDHWIAYRLDKELFWGPEYALQLINKMHMMKDQTDWLDENWCEGGALIDTDNQILVWFGGENIMHDLPLRKTFMHLLAANWSSWQIWWAAEGVADLGRYVGLDSTVFAVKRKLDKKRFFKISEDYPEDNTCLLSIQKGDQIKVAKIMGDDERMLLGEKQLKLLMDFAQHDSVDFQGVSPECGLHLNLDTKTMLYWTWEPSINSAQKMARAWPSWHCVDISEDFEQHQLLIPGQVVGIKHVDSKTLQKAILDDLIQSCHHNQENPINGISNYVDGEIEINSWTQCHVQSLGSEGEKLAFLSQLSKKLLD